MASPASTPACASSRRRTPSSRAWTWPTRKTHSPPLATTLRRSRTCPTLTTWTTLTTRSRATRMPWPWTWRKRMKPLRPRNRRAPSRRTSGARGRSGASRRASRPASGASSRASSAAVRAWTWTWTPPTRRARGTPRTRRPSCSTRAGTPRQIASCGAPLVQIWSWMLSRWASTSRCTVRAASRRSSRRSPRTFTTKTLTPSRACLRTCRRARSAPTTRASCRRI
mmetsp:Transcript_39751/g.124144  ORF Transcript_39751/g.124144 Transcript_39751/m.124144 type:complete len:225 (-) Transcript_39751:1088-1762(-)